jgi:hypothetical protein
MGPFRNVKYVYLRPVVQQNAIAILSHDVTDDSKRQRAAHGNKEEKRAKSECATDSNARGFESTSGLKIH